MNKVRVIHNTPGKKGKQEYREFTSLAEALSYIQKNGGRVHGATPRFKEADFRYSQGKRK
jgi:hypothetical protein